MKFLLDTHVFIWADSQPEKLSDKAKACWEAYDHQIVLSTASVWELQIKLMLGKLSLSRSLRSIIDDHQQRNAMEILPITLDHVLTLEKLPSHHKDPFDRLLIAQAISEGMTIVTHDRAFSLYEVSVIW